MKISTQILLQGLYIGLIGIQSSPLALGLGDDSPLRLLVIGESGSGKTTFINNFYNLVSGRFNKYNEAERCYLPHEQFYTPQNFHREQFIEEEAGQIYASMMAQMRQLHDMPQEETLVPSIDEILKCASARPERRAAILVDSKVRYQALLPVWMGQRRVNAVSNLDVIPHVYQHIEGEADINERANAAQTRSIKGYQFKASATSLAGTDVELIDTPGLSDPGNPGAEGQVITDVDIQVLLDNFLKTEEVHAVIFVESNGNDRVNFDNIVQRRERYAQMLGYYPTLQDDARTYRNKYGERLFFVVADKSNDGATQIPFVSHQDEHGNVGMRRFWDARQEVIQDYKERVVDNVLPYNHSAVGQGGDGWFVRGFLARNLFAYTTPFNQSWHDFVPSGGSRAERLFMNFQDRFLVMAAEFETIASKLSRIDRATPWPYDPGFIAFRTHLRDFLVEVCNTMRIKEQVHALKQAMQKQTQKEINLLREQNECRKQSTKAVEIAWEAYDATRTVEAQAIVQAPLLYTLSRPSTYVETDLAITSTENPMRSSVLAVGKPHLPIDQENNGLLVTPKGEVQRASILGNQTVQLALGNQHTLVGHIIPPEIEAQRALCEELETSWVEDTGTDLGWYALAPADKTFSGTEANAVGPTCLLPERQTKILTLSCEAMKDRVQEIDMELQQAKHAMEDCQQTIKACRDPYHQCIERMMTHMDALRTSQFEVGESEERQARYTQQIRAQWDHDPQIRTSYRSNESIQQAIERRVHYAWAGEWYFASSDEEGDSDYEYDLK